LKSSLQKFYSRHHDLVNCYGISVSQMSMDMFHLSTRPGLFLIHDLSVSWGAREPNGLMRKGLLYAMLKKNLKIPKR
jgi:hypothetical protein